jgi:hypothetical protein
VQHSADAGRKLGGGTRAKRGAERIHDVGRLRDQCEIAGDATASAVIDEGVRLIVVRAVEPRHQNRHRAFAAEADAPDHVVRAARVVVGDHGRAGEHRSRALHQI